MRKTLLGVAAVAAFAAGCETVDSDDVATEGIYAHFEINGYSTTDARASGNLRVGGSSSNTFLDLTENDALIAYRSDEESRAMAKQDNGLGFISYHATFGVATNGTPFKISFLRTHDPSEECAGESAPNSAATMPMPYMMTIPAGPYSRTGAGIPITWSPFGESDPMYWNASGPCIQPTGNQAISDTGSYTIPAGTLVGGTAGTCTISIGLERRRGGTLDPAYGEGGTIWAAQIRSVQVTSDP